MTWLKHTKSMLLNNCSRSLVSQPLSNTWLYRTLAAIMIGNQFYDKFAGNIGQMFGVQDAATKMQQARALGSIHMSGELPASITREQIPSACLPFTFFKHVT